MKQFIPDWHLILPRGKESFYGQNKRQVPTHKMGPYGLCEKIGQGCMGIVYKAHEKSLDRPVAIKILSSHLSGKREYQKRFLCETRTTAKLHPAKLISQYASHGRNQPQIAIPPAILAVKYTLPLRSNQQCRVGIQN